MGSVLGGIVALSHDASGNGAPSLLWHVTVCVRDAAAEQRLLYAPYPLACHEFTHPARFPVSDSEGFAAVHSAWFVSMVLSLRRQLTVRVRLAVVEHVLVHVVQSLGVSQRYEQPVEMSTGSFVVDGFVLVQSASSCTTAVEVPPKRWHWTVCVFTALLLQVDE